MNRRAAAAALVGGVALAWLVGPEGLGQVVGDGVGSGSPSESEVGALSARPCGAAPEGMACVPGGAFTRGLDVGHACEQTDQPRDGRPSEVPAQRVFVETFYMDLTEVTVAAWEGCAAAEQCRDVAPVYADFDAPRQPMTAMSWADAVQFCEARGAHLPTEAEWELAARGPDGELNPWGNEPADCERAIVQDDRGRSCGTPQRSRQAENGRVFEVGSRPPGRYGLYDLVGNAEEWVADWWSEDWTACGVDCVGPNPRGPCGGESPCAGHRYRVVRGGSWYWGGEHASGAHRRRARPANDPPHHYGFRCAASLDELAATSDEQAQ